MKILALSNLYPPNVVGGYEILCFNVMQALVERGHHITVLTSNYGGGQVDFSGQKIMRTLNLLAAIDNIYAPFPGDATERATINRNNRTTLQQTLAAEKPDIVFVWNLHFLHVSFLDTLEQANVRSVYLLTDNWLISFYNQHFISEYFATRVHGRPGRLKNFVKLQIRRLLLRQKHQPEIAASAIFASSFMANLYRQAGISFARHVIIYHGILPAASTPVVSRDRSKLLNRQELRLLFAGRIVDIKGVHTAIEAMPLIIKAFPQLQVKLTIVGDDRDKPYFEKLCELIRTLAIGGQVNFSPPVAEDDLPHLFQQNDIYLFPSLYEPFSLTLIHALRSGIPTVASKAGGTPEIVKHRQTGMLFDTANSVDLARQVIHLVQAPGLRDNLSGQARDYASQFTFSRMVDKVENYLTQTS